MSSRFCWIAVLAFVGSLGLPDVSRGDFLVTLDTSGLSTSKPYEIELQFNQGTGTTTDAATVSGITFGSGGSAGSGSTITTSGSVTGNLQSQPIVLSGSSAEFIQAFSAGSELQLRINLSNPTQSLGTVSDTFTLGILYQSGNNFYNLPTNNNNAFVEIQTNPGASPSYTASASLCCHNPIPTPSVEVTPAPSSLALVLVGFLVIGLCRVYRSSNQAARTGSPVPA